SQGLIAGKLNRYPDIAARLFDLFVARFDPASAASDAAETRAANFVQEYVSANDADPSIDDDTSMRRRLNLISSTLRTNYFAATDLRGVKTLALKVDSRAVEGMPEPRPWREMFVYGPEVEGVHLRFGPVARGGLRWSDRAQDYRTEVLGL